MPNPIAGGPVPSPCISVCVMDERTGLCTGCQRTLDEIAGWLDFSAAQRLEVLNRLEERRPGHSVRLK